MSDDEIWLLNRGGHDQQKVYAAYHEAVRHTGQPTVILAKTIKGYGMGVSGEGQMITHQAKKMTEDALLRVPRPLRAAADRRAGARRRVLQAARGLARDAVPARAPRGARRQPARAAPARGDAGRSPTLDLFKSQLEGTGEREISTTMAFVRVLAALLRDKQIGRHIVPIVPDESRTFGMEGLFRQVGIYSPFGQLYQPQDSEQLMFYKEDEHGQILEEGITEAGSISSFIAAGTSYSAHDVQMVPFYIYYSMFGYQRVGDLVWAAADSRTRGFMLGGTAGRTTLNGEGLQHEDGHSHVLFSVVPNCRAYDPTFGYEVAVIIQDGLRRMVVEQEDVFYYVTLMNENYRHPPMPEDAQEGILRGMYLLRETPERTTSPRVQLLGSGTILREVLAAAELLESDFGSAPTCGASPRSPSCAATGSRSSAGTCCTRCPSRAAPTSPSCLRDRRGPVIASTDYLRAFADQIRQWVPGHYRVLGTDGFGRSDFRHALRRFFEVDRHYVVVAALKELADDGEIEPRVVPGGDRALRDRPRRADPDQDMSATDVVSVEVPDIGDFEDVPVIEILVSPGDTVETDDPLLTLESDKATMDVPAPFAGTIKDIQVSVGDRVSQGRALLTMEQSGSAAGQSEASAAASDGAATEAQAPDAVESAVEAEEASAPAAESDPLRLTRNPLRADAGTRSRGVKRGRVREPFGPAPCPRARHRPPSGPRQRPQGPDHERGRRAVLLLQDGPAPASPAGPDVGSRPGARAQRSTSRSSARSSGWSGRGSSGSRRRTWRATG